MRVRPRRPVLCISDYAIWPQIRDIDFEIVSAGMDKTVNSRRIRLRFPSAQGERSYAEFSCPTASLRRAFNYPIVTIISFTEPAGCGLIGPQTSLPFNVVATTPFSTPCGLFTVIL